MAHGDFTGRNKQRLAVEFADQQRLAAQSKTLVTQVVEEGRNQTIDLFTDKDHENLAIAKQYAAEGFAEEGVVQVGVQTSTDVNRYEAVKFRASEDLDQITVGQGREFSLKAGNTYQAPRWVVQHLDEQGLVWH